MWEPVFISLLGGFQFGSCSLSRSRTETFRDVTVRAWPWGSHLNNEAAKPRLKSTETKALKRSGMRWMSIRTIWSLRTGRSTTYFAK